MKQPMNNNMKQSNNHLPKRKPSPLELWNVTSSPEEAEENHFVDGEDDSSDGSSPIHQATVSFQGNYLLVHRNNTLVKQFKVTKKLGMGAQGNVYHVIDESNGVNLALKRVKVSDIEEMKQAKLEVEHCLKLDHVSIVKVYDIFEHVSIEEDEYALYFTMELYEKGDLSSLISNYRLHKRFFTQEQIYHVLYDISDALSYIHSEKLAHRDLKPPNIFIAQTEPVLKVVIGDFGLSKTIESVSKRHSFVGSLNTMSPEIYMGDKYSFKVDVFSLGCIIFMMMSLNVTRNIAWELNGCGELKTFDQLRKEIQNTRQTYDRELVHVLTKMLKLKAEDRPDAHAIKRFCLGRLKSSQDATSENTNERIEHAEHATGAKSVNRTKEPTIPSSNRSDENTIENRIKEYNESLVSSPIASKLGIVSKPKSPSHPPDVHAVEELVLYVTRQKKSSIIESVMGKKQKKPDNVFYSLESALQMADRHISAKSITVHVSAGVFQLSDDNYHIPRYNVSIIGEENRTIILGEKLVISQLGITLAGLRFTSRSSSQPFIIEIVEADAVIEHCIIDGRISISNCSGGIPVIRENEILGNFRPNDSDASVNHVLDDALTVSASTVHVEGNHIHHNSTNGIGVYSKSGGFIGSNILSNHLKGQGIALFICEDANFVLKSNTIHGNFNAIYVANSRVVISDNTIHSNRKGIVVNCSKVIIENCSLYLHEQVAVYIGNMGSVKLNNNVMRSNSMSVCSCDSHVELKENTVLENFEEFPAIGISGSKSSFLVSKNEFCRNSGGVVLTQDCSGLIDGNNFVQNSLYAIKANECQSKIQHNTIQSQKNGSCIVLERAKPKSIITRNKIQYHLSVDHSAIAVTYHSTNVEITLNSIENGMGSGVLVCYNSTITKFSDNGFVGNLDNIAVMVYRNQNCSILTAPHRQEEQDMIGEEASIIKYNVFLNNRDSVLIHT